jgi:RNA polymerase sigma-70 factor, ECF subfamily
MRIPLDDKNSVSLLVKGNSPAFENLFNRYAKRLYFFAFGYLKSKSDAEEVVQEVFLKIWQNRTTLNPELSFNAYLFKIAYHLITEKFRKISLEQKYLRDITQEAIPINDELNERSNYQSLLELVEKFIDKLPGRQKEVLLLRRMNGLSVREISEKLEISPKTVEHHLTEALKSIRLCLDKDSTAVLLFFILFVRN